MTLAYALKRGQGRLGVCGGAAGSQAGVHEVTYIVGTQTLPNSLPVLMAGPLLRSFPHLPYTVLPGGEQACAGHCTSHKPSPLFSITVS